MASGIAISDEVIKHFEGIRVRLQGSEEKERFKLVVMQLSEDQKSIVVDHQSSLKNKDVEKEENIFKKVVSMLPEKECRYALYDCTYETKETLKEDLVFIMWAPDDASLKSKMVYASSKGALRAKFPGLKLEWQVNDPADKEISALMEKLGGKSKLKSIEGICL
ncbi:non-muscle cofilin 1-like [Colossoma macropomum]|uniref:non-muscle cofilin 1-like n=1 Tax=Colossoma macropomum TaxID=42526 RepID=UPI0018655D44|nr:non-muscle cofilin 1-like [Colossoma macropomum]